MGLYAVYGNVLYNYVPRAKACGKKSCHVLLDSRFNRPYTVTSAFNTAYVGHVCRFLVGNRVRVRLHLRNEGESSWLTTCLWTARSFKVCMVWTLMNNTSKRC